MADKDYFLKLTGIQGDAEAKGHEGEIDVLDFSWDEVQDSSSDVGSGHTRGRVKMNDLVVHTKTNKASPTLMIKCATGETIDQVVLTCRKAIGSGGQKDYLKWTLSKAYITGYRQCSPSDAKDALPRDEIRIAFDVIKFEYCPQKGNSLEAAVTATYNYKKRVKE